MSAHHLKPTEQMIFRYPGTILLAMRARAELTETVKMFTFTPSKILAGRIN
jgi:hypothetical protein